MIAGQHKDHRKITPLIPQGSDKVDEKKLPARIPRFLQQYSRVILQRMIFALRSILELLDKQCIVSHVFVGCPACFRDVVPIKLSAPQDVRAQV